MALLERRRKGSLADYSGRLDQARSHLQTVEASITIAAKTRADRLALLAEEGIDDVQSLVEKRAEISAVEAALVKQREAIQESISELEARCATLAVAEAEERVETLRTALEPLALERLEIEARLHAIGMAEADLHEQISDAVDAVTWAASAYSTSAKANAEAAKVQENERIRWIARASREAREAELRHASPRFRRLVEEERERLAAEPGRQRAKQREDAIESWRPLVRNAEEGPDFARNSLRPQEQ